MIGIMKKIVMVIIIIVLLASFSCKKQDSHYVKQYPLENIRPINYKQEIISGFTSDFPHKFLWEVQLPSDGTLEFAVAVRKHTYEDFPERLQLSVKEKRSTITLLNKQIKLIRQHGQIFYYKVPLKGFKNKQLFLEFELKSNKNNKSFSDIIIWGTPTIFSEARSEKINIVLITIDALRADHLGCYGYKYNSAPNITKFANEAFVFNRAFATDNSTWSALTSVMTSTYPTQHGVVFNGYRFRNNFISLPEILQQNGYQTIALLANMGQATHKGYDYLLKTNNDEILTNVATQKLNQFKDKPFFMWMHYFGTHAVYKAPDKYLSKYGLTPQDLKYGLPPLHYALMGEQKPIPDAILQKIIKLYDANIDATDYLVSTVLAEINRLGLKDKTMIIFSADHGETLGQHLNYLYHSGALYDAALRIPLLWYIPGKPLTQKSTDELVSSIDIAPTILSYLNIKIPPSFQGINLLKLFKGESLERKWVFSESYGKIYSLRDKKYRYTINPHKEEITIVDTLKVTYDEELYRHPADELEQHNIIKEEPKIATAYRQMLMQWVNKNLPASVPAQTIDEATKEQLKALGYVNP